MTKIIFIAGAPGSGKTTISNKLKIKLNDCPLIDFGWIREFHLNKSWSNANDKEEQMSFENLVFILKNYIKNEYPYVIVNDLKDSRITEIPKIFNSANYLIFSLLVKDENELIDWYEKLKAFENRVSIFREPDIGNQVTGIACLSKGREFRKLKLLAN